MLLLYFPFYQYIPLSFSIKKKKNVWCGHVGQDCEQYLWLLYCHNIIS